MKATDASYPDVRANNYDLNDQQLIGSITDLYVFFDYICIIWIYIPSIDTKLDVPTIYQCVFWICPWFGNEDWDPLDEDGKIYVNPEWWFSVDGPSELPFVGLNSQIYEFDISVTYKPHWLYIYIYIHTQQICIIIKIYIYIQDKYIYMMYVLYIYIYIYTG